MKKLSRLMIVVLWCSFTVLGQSANDKIPAPATEKEGKVLETSPKTITLTAIQVTGYRIAKLESENLQIRIALLQQQLQDAQRQVELRAKSEIAALTELAKLAGIKPEELELYDVKVLETGDWTLTRKPGK